MEIREALCLSIMALIGLYAYTFAGPLFHVLGEYFR